MGTAYKWTHDMVNMEFNPPVPTLYWVDPAGSNVTGDGTNLLPWETLDYACTRVVTPGDTIHLTAGTHTVANRCDLALGVNIVGAGVTTIINSTYVALSTADGAIRLNASTGNPVNGNQSISYIRLTGSALTATRAMAINFRNNVNIHHCTIEQFNDSGIRFNCSASNYNVAPTNLYATGNQVHDCIITNCSTHTSGVGGHVRPEGTEGLLLYNNVFDQTDRAAGSNSDIIAGYWNKGIQIHDNVFTKNDNEAAGWNFFFELHYSQGGMDVYNNTFNGAATCDVSGVIMGTYGYGARIHNNDFLVAATAPVDAAYSPCITLESFDREDYIYIYQNYFKNVRGGIYLDNVYTSADNIWIYYNIFENVGQSTDNFSFGILIKSYWEATDAATPYSNIYILNNVIDCGTEGFDGIGAYIDGTITNLNIQNNIINGNWEDYAIDFKLGGGAAAATVATLNLNNNIFYGTGGDSFHHAAAITITTEDSSGNLTSDPTFVGAADFHLQAGSPAINAGLPVGLTMDFAGDLVGVVPEIGAYKY